MLFNEYGGNKRLFQKDLTQYRSRTVSGYATASTFGSLPGTGNKWDGGVLAPNGMIYGIPRDSTSVLEINPITKTVSTFGSLGTGNKWLGGVLAPNGMIYGIPYNSTTVLEIGVPTTTDPKLLSAYYNRF